MTVIKLNDSHADKIKHLFFYPKFMGLNPNQNYFVGTKENFSEFYHASFVDSYLSELTNYHAFGFLNSIGKITAIIAFYVSIDDASWYWTQIRTEGNNSNEIKNVLDAVLDFNEKQGIFKFYSMFPKRYVKSYRKLAFSDSAKTRYEYFDEYYVESKNVCRFTLAWQILYNRTLLPVDTVVRCTFLKQEHRTKLVNAGHL